MRLPARLPLDDLAATRRFGTQLAGLLRPGDAVMLEGDLGAGKTTLARAVIAEACGVEDAPSPTYTLVQVYDTADGDVLWHADLYRIEEGRRGVVVTFLAVMELIKESLVEIVQTDSFGPIHVKARSE